MKRAFFLLAAVVIGVVCFVAAADIAKASPACDRSAISTDDETDNRCSQETTSTQHDNTSSPEMRITPTTDLELPEEWEDDWDSDDLWWWFECDDILEEGRPIHTQETWNLLRNTYRSIVGSANSSILPTNDKNGWYVPYQAKLAPGKGRGVFATAFIPKGARVWTSHEHQSARFDNGHDYRRFLGAIPEDLACDVLQWAYVQNLGSAYQPKLYICADLDEGSLVNSGGTFYGPRVYSNVGCLPTLADKYEGGCAENLFALRDIEAGEELLVDYSEFAIPEGWEEFGL